MTHSLVALDFCAVLKPLYFFLAEFLLDYKSSIFAYMVVISMWLSLFGNHVQIWSTITYTMMNNSLILYLRKKCWSTVLNQGEMRGCTG